MISATARPRFFKLQHRAWLAHADRTLGVDPSDRGAETAWRYEETFAVLGVTSTAEIDPVEGMDAIMLHWAQIAGDDKEIAYWSTAKERRLQKRLCGLMQDLASVERQPITWQYVRGIAAQAQLNMPNDLQDCPAEVLWKLCQMLVTHVRRLRRRASAGVGS